jgi:hypothetical protein
MELICEDLPPARGTSNVICKGLFVETNDRCPICGHTLATTLAERDR